MYYYESFSWIKLQTKYLKFKWIVLVNMEAKILSLKISRKFYEFCYLKQELILSLNKLKKWLKTSISRIIKSELFWFSDVAIWFMDLRIWFKTNKKFELITIKKYSVIKYYSSFGQSMYKADSLHRVYVIVQNSKICWQINESKLVIS